MGSTQSCHISSEASGNIFEKTESKQSFIAEVAN
jgi:hypothetical protein